MRKRVKGEVGGGGVAIDRRRRRRNCGDGTNHC